MKSLPLALLVCVCGATTALAQQASTKDATLTAKACPVSMTAKQASATEMVKVQSGQNPRPETLSKPGQRIRLFLMGLPKGGRVFATVTVRGLSARGHVDRADAGDSPDLRRTLNVTFMPEDEKTVQAELILPGFTAVKSVKLEALEFSDGSTRDLGGMNACTVAPDPIMLVAAR